MVDETLTSSSQRADLRAVVSYEATYALVGQITVKGNDIYCVWSDLDGPKGRRIETLRISHHESGASRLHILGGDTQAHITPAVEPIDLKGALKIGSGAPVLRDADYVYRPRADSDTRRTLSISADQLTRGMAVEYWALEVGSADALDTALNVPGAGVPLELVDYVLSDWTKPHVLIVVKTVTEDHWPRLVEAFDSGKWNDGRITPFILAVTSTIGQGHYRPSGLFIPGPGIRVPQSD